MKITYNKEITVDYNLEVTKFLDWFKSTYPDYTIDDLECNLKTLLREYGFEDSDLLSLDTVKDINHIIRTVA